VQTRGLASGHASSMVTSTAMPPVGQQQLCQASAGRKKVAAVSIVCVADLDMLAGKAGCNTVCATSQFGLPISSWNNQSVQETFQMTCPMLSDMSIPCAFSV